MTNQVIENIMTRRSVRRYEARQVEESLMAKVLECAINAPSALNQQPWQVRCVQNPEVLNKINDEFRSWARDKNLPGSASRAAEADFSVFHHAPSLIVVAADKDNHYSHGDCGMLAQNIMLSAHSLGLGTCVIGNIKRVAENSADWFRTTMNIDDGYEVVFGIAIGYPAETPAPKVKDSSKAEIIR